MGPLQGPLPLPPLAPVLRGEVQTLGVDAQVPLVHGPLVALHDVLRQRQDVLTLGRETACHTPLILIPFKSHWVLFCINQTIIKQAFVIEYL